MMQCLSSTKVILNIATIKIL